MRTGSGPILVVAALAASSSLSCSARPTQDPVAPQPAVASSDEVAPPEETVAIHAVLDKQPLGLEADAVALIDSTGESTPITAARLVKYRDGDQPLALVVLVQGDERWMGNETYMTDEQDLMEGAYQGIKPALEAFEKTAPAGSHGALIVYVGGIPKVKKAMGPISGLAAALGAQQDYRGIGVPLNPALDQAIHVLSEAIGRTVLVVIGDGTGQQEDISVELNNRIENLRGLMTEVFTVYFAGASYDSTGPGRMKALGYSGNFLAATRIDVTTRSQEIIDVISSRYLVTFEIPVSMEARVSDKDLRISVNDQTVAFVTYKPKPPPSD